MAEHRITILNRITMPEAGIELVCNNPTDTIRFEFDEEWSGVAAKTARFSWEGKYIDVPFSGNVVEMPEIYRTNYVYVGVYADNIASTPAKVKCRYSIKCLGGRNEPPKPDVYAQIIGLLNAEAENNKEVNDRVSAIENYEPRPFEITGNSVTVENFEGMPLNVVSELTVKQTGSGDPYPAGGGKNLFNIHSLGAGGTAAYNIVSDSEVVVSATTDGYISVDSQPFTLKAGTYTMSGEVILGGVDNLYSNLILKTKTGSATDIWIGQRNKTVHKSPQTFTVEDGVYYMRFYAAGMGYSPNGGENTYRNVQLEAGSVATEYAPYSNVRPITGYNALGLTRCGKNLIPRPYYREGLSGAVYESKGITWTVREDGSIHAKGVATDRSEYVLCGKANSSSRSNLIIPSGSYTLSGWRNISGYTPSSSNVGYIQISKYNDAENAGAKYNGKENTPVVWTCESSSEIYIVIRIMKGIDVDTVFYPQLETDSATEYEPRRGNTYTVQIGQTVYGGRMDWNTGKLISEWVLVTLDSNSVVRTWGEHGACAMYAMPKTSNEISTSGIISSHFPTRSGAALWLNDEPGVFNNYEYSEICFANPAFTTVDDWKAYIAEQYAAGTPVQVAYKMAEPVEIQLTPHEILALQGANTLYGDGEITISGRTDMQAVVSNLLKRIAILEATINS